MQKRRKDNKCKSFLTFCYNYVNLPVDEGLNLL